MAEMDRDSPPPSSRSPVYQTTHGSASESESELALDRLFSDRLFENKIQPLIFSQLTLVELLLLQSVSKQWNRVISITISDWIENLHLGQFWASLGAGTENLLSFQELINKFQSIKSINVAYCHLLTGSTLSTIVQSLATNHIAINPINNTPYYANIISLNLFYCYLITDDTIDFIIAVFPHLLRLNIGRCTSISEHAIIRLGKLLYLQELVLVHNPNLGEEFTMGFDDDHYFSSLTRLNITHCNKLSQTQMDEIKISRKEMKKELIIIGPNPPIRPNNHNDHGHHHRRDHHRHHERDRERERERERERHRDREHHEKHSKKDRNDDSDA